MGYGSGSDGDFYSKPFQQVCFKYSGQRKVVFLIFSVNLVWDGGESKLGNGERRTESVVSQPWQVLCAPQSVLVDVLHLPRSSSVASVPGVWKAAPHP